MENYTGYKNPIATGEGFEGLKLSMNCFKKKTRDKINILLGIVVDKSPLKPFAQAEINRLSFDGETIQQTMNRMLKEGKNWDEIAREVHKTSDEIYLRSLN